jgi:SAM-dependent methyltransferase
VLDVGAGPGTITADLARIVGHVTATEISDDVLGLTAAATQGLDVDLRVADVHALPFADGTFDVTHAHQVLQHVADPVTALREMARVTTPGGLVAARDADYSGFAWWPAIPALDDWMRLYCEAARTNGGEPDAGRRMFAWAHAAGLTDVAATSSTWCFATPQERAWWGGMWADRITESALARQLVDEHRATTADLARIRAGWLEWADNDDGWISILHGEILARVS